MSDLKEAKQYYESLKEVPFVEGKHNCFIGYNDKYEHFYIDVDIDYNGQLLTRKYISEEDARTFYEKFKKEVVVHCSSN